MLWHPSRFQLDAIMLQSSHSQLYKIGQRELGLLSLRLMWYARKVFQVQQKKWVLSTVQFRYPARTSQAALLEIDSRRHCQFMVVSRSRFYALIRIRGRCFVKRASPDARIVNRRIVKRDSLGRGTHSLTIECKRGLCFLRTISFFSRRLSKQV